MRHMPILKKDKYHSHTSTIEETVLEISRQLKWHETGTEIRTLIYNAVKCWAFL